MALMRPKDLVGPRSRGERKGTRNSLRNKREASFKRKGKRNRVQNASNRLWVEGHRCLTQRSVEKAPNQLNGGVCANKSERGASTKACAGFNAEIKRPDRVFRVKGRFR